MCNAAIATTLLALPSSCRAHEAWANGGGSTAVILREPGTADWKIRISIAQVERNGPFSELPDTKRLLIPLDAAIELRFADGRASRAERFEVLRFDGAPAPLGVLPDGPTRDFNLMTRGDACAELLARTLVDGMILLPEPGARWLVYLNSGSATIEAGGEQLVLTADDAALLAFAQASSTRAAIEGAGEIVLAKLYA